MDSNAFLNDLMSKMKLPEAKGKKKAEQSESMAQILAAMQKVKTEKKKPPVTSYAPTKEMPVNELESMEEFSQLASDVMQECRPAIPAVKTSISEKTVRVAAYIRVSSTNPAQEDSYEMQERYFMSLLAGNAGWTSAGIYSDHGISATSREGRTGFNRLLRHCKQGKIDRVICKSISRFARNTQDFLVALRTLKENNVTILFEREAMDTADAYSEFILTTLAAIAQEESRSISANIAWSNQKRFPAGNVCNKDIYGYEFRKGEYTVNENGYRYRAVFIIPEEAEIVRMVFRFFTKEELSFTQIAQKLDALHIPPPNSGCRQRQKRKPTVLPAGALKEEDKRGWTATDVRYMIANVRYCGSVLCQKTYTDHRNGHKQKVNKGEKPKYLIRNHHPAIISEELWQEAQEVWKAYTAKYRGIEKGRNERNYSKLLLCGECGRYFQGHSTTRTTIWRCATKLAQQGQKRCRMEPIYEEQIQTLLCKAFAEKFKLGEKMDAEVHEVMQMISKAPIDNARNQALKNLTEKLREIHDFDHMEQEGDFLKRQLSAVNYSITDSNLNHTGIYLYSKGKIMIHLTFDYKTDEKCTTPGQYLKYHRTFQGLSTRELAEKVGIVPATLVLYENDRHPIKHSTAVALANALGIDRNRLLDKYTAFVDYPYSSLLKKVRQDLSLTQIQMAELIGIGQTSYSGWEREIRVPRRKEYDKILAALEKLRVNVDTYLCQSASI